MELTAIWGAAGVLVGFQVAALTLRINREIDRGDKHDITWLPPADMLNMVSMTVTLLFVFLAPAIGLADGETAGRAFGFSVLMLAGYPFTLAGHYEMWNRHSRRSWGYFPFQEKLCLAAVAVAGLAYLAALAIWL